MSKDFGWAGMWLDNARQTFGFTGNDGKPYLVTGDYMSQSYHWQELKGWEQVIHSTFPLTVTPATAEVLAMQKPEPVPVWPVPAPPKVVIKKLPQPLPIDGDPRKWRTLGIQPLVAISDDPASNSCILRDRWGSGGLIGQDVAPRNITVYENAADFEERKMIEAATGLDLMKSKVVCIEFKLTKEALSNLPAHRQVAFESGKTFIFGFMINDNDIPGADIVKPLTWPVTYGTFETDDRYATGVFE